MSYSDDRLCPVCIKLDIPALFNPARFDDLPDIHTSRSHQTSWTKYIQHAGDWRPLTREERIGHYPPGIIPSCPFCEVVLGIGHSLSRNSRENERVILALPSNLLYDFAVVDEKADVGGAPTSVFLLVMNRTQFSQTSAQYFGNTTMGGGMTAWIRFAHRQFPGSLISVVSSAVLQPPLLDLPMQGRYLRDERIDYGLVRSWIQLCEDQHENCHGNRNWQAVPKLKLIDCESRRIINTDPSKRYSYVALSYVWGSAPPEKYTYPSLPEDLPPVILDTMRAVTKLGFRYVWVDRYCIWQDDKNHKMSQVERMDQIYGDADLTIIAIGAKDPSYGLPGLTLSRTQHTQITKKIGQQNLVANFSHHWQLNEISKSKWATRGWTFQETCLSRRRLYFSNYEVSFECHDMMCFEHLTRPLAFKGSLEHHERPEWNHLNTPDGVWAIINNYCERQLSYPSDRLAAITGVLRKWARVNPGCSSYWGVPVVASGWPVLNSDATKRAFLAGLEWEVRPNVVEPGRLAEFPSWSWVSQNGRSLFSHIHYYHLQPPNLIQKTEKFDAEVWVEASDGRVVEWSKFCDEGGLELPFSLWTRFLHIECWSFQTGLLCRRQLQRSSGLQDNIVYAPTSTQSGDKQTTIVLKLTPDSGYGDLSGFTGRELMAISFSPLDHSTFAIVLDTIPGFTVRVGLLAFVELIDRGSYESEAPKDQTFAASGFTAQRRRVRLG